MYYSPRHLARTQQLEARKALKFWYRAFTVTLALGLWMTIWFVWALS